MQLLYIKRICLDRSVRSGTTRFHAILEGGQKLRREAKPRLLAQPGPLISGDKGHSAAHFSVELLRVGKKDIYSPTERLRESDGLVVENRDRSPTDTLALCQPS